MRFLLTFVVVAVLVTGGLTLYPSLLSGGSGRSEIRAERQSDRSSRLPREFIFNVAAGVVSGVIASAITRRR